MKTELWDEGPMRDALMDEVQRCNRLRLDHVAALPDSPGVYLLFLALAPIVHSAPTPLAAAVGDIVASGRYPAYCGVAERSLRERLGRYRQGVAHGTRLAEHDLFIAALSLPSGASAAFAERCLIELLDPPLQGCGFGSKHPGGHRSEQSPIDALLPGRRWAKPASLAAQAEVRLRILARLLRLDPAGPRWSPILTTSPGR